MILKETLRKSMELQSAEKASLGTEREMLKEIDLSLPHAVILSGIRRCGKSTLLRQLMALKKKHYYFNFEDPRVMGFETADFDKLDGLFHELYGEAEHYFFDEVQNVKGWERYVRRLLDQKKKVVVTGSNASLLSRELGTHLTGRHLTYELFPFSYSEMIRMKQKTSGVGSFQEYLEKGGFPEYLIYGKEQMLQELVRDIVTRDIIVRYNLREEKIIKDLAIYLLSNVGKEFTYNQLKRTFQLGSVNSVISYISYFEECYLLFTIPQFDYSYKKLLIAPKKVYAIDGGLARANTVSFSEDKGRMLENLVFLELRRTFKDIFYFKGEKECDFVVKQKGKMALAVQVCFEVNDENMAREREGLKEAMKKLKIPQGGIITFSQEENLGDIPVVPLWKLSSGKKALF